MALHYRSRAGPVRSSLGKRVPQTRNAQLGLTMLHQQSSRMSRQKVVLRRARATLDKIPPRRRSRRREHIQQFWDSETDRAQELGVFG